MTVRAQPCSSLVDYVVSPAEAPMTMASGARKVPKNAVAEAVVAAPALHYLEQLQPAEIARASAAVAAYAVAHNVGELRFNTVMLQEPRKSEQLAFEHGRGPRPCRQALAVVLVPRRELAVEALVTLQPHGSDEVVSWKELSGVQPMTTPDDNFLAEDIVKGCPETMALIAERYDLPPGAILICDAWACHNMPEHLNAKRLMQCFLYVKLSRYDNEYAHPLDLVPVVDLHARKVVHVDMYDRAAKMPPLPANYHRDLARQEGVVPRDDVMPLNITQPMGPSFTVEGSLVRWQRWQFRVGFNAREGLVLHQLAYNDGGRARPVLHRASLVEMAVPYGDPSYPYVRKCAFDIGDYGMGFNCNSLTLGCDCLGHIQYFDGHVNDAEGRPVTIRRAVCMHEEDAGVAWKHWDSRTNHSEVRRARRLVLSQVSTFQNYEYCAYWYLFQDGTISFELKLTGILSTSNSPGPANKYGVEVHEGVAATVHQHFACMRIDPAVDDDWGGKSLVVSEVEAREVPHSASSGNPYGNGFYMHETELAHTGQARRDHNFALARSWKIKNPFSINPTSKQPVAYKLLPAPSPKLMAAPGSLVAKRAVFASKALWVTPFADDQKYPAGEHVVQARECTGLAQWTKQDKPLLGGADPVLWYTFGVTHSPRVEDFPIMPVEVTGFMLRPCGFFSTNPCTDLPWDKNTASKEHQAAAGGACCQPMSKM